MTERADAQPLAQPVSLQEQDGTQLFARYESLVSRLEQGGYDETTALERDALREEIMRRLMPPPPPKPVYDTYPLCTHCGGRRCFHFGRAEYCTSEGFESTEGTRYEPSGEPPPLLGYRHPDGSLSADPGPKRR